MAVLLKSVIRNRNLARNHNLIAEGNGKHTAPDRCRFFDIARSSALECAACLDVRVAIKRLARAEQGKEIRVRIVSMLVGLIRSTSADRIHDERAEYATDNRRLAD
jgi:hypothetical protein